MMSYDRFKAKTQNLSKFLGIENQLIHRYYYFERYLERLAQSKFRNYIIWKGGVLITSFFGLYNRSTRDLDLAWTGDSLSEEKAEAVISGIGGCDLNDGVSFKLRKTRPLVINSNQAGWRGMLDVSFTKIRHHLLIDLVSDDIAKELSFKYNHKLLFEDRYINMCAQSMESILVDKFLASHQHGLENSRLKDFYDMHMFTTVKAAEISPQVFADILNHVVDKRGIQLGDVRGIIDSIGASTDLQIRWERYQQTHPYAVNITFQHTVAALAKLAGWAGFGSGC
jgi:predicted nucleotidyltransferase component of viral defense system